MKVSILKLGAFILLIALMGAGCKKKEEREMKNVSITLHDKPLSVIQQYTTGKWKLQYLCGGFFYRKIINTDSSYMILNPSHITMGNNMRIFEDANIVWTRYEWVKNNFTYLFSIPDNPPHYFVERIKNDTLIFREEADDGCTFYYTKN